MPKCFASGRGKIAASVVFSIVLHGSLGMAWLSLRPARSASQPDDPTAVDGPDDGELVITLREPPKDIIAQPTLVEPRRLPTEIEIPSVSVPVGPGTEVQAANPPISTIQKELHESHLHNRRQPD